LRGHCIVFSKDLVNFVEQLPRSSAEIEMLVIIEESINFVNE
jgi:hypothetical protein